MQITKKTLKVHWQSCETIQFHVKKILEDPTYVYMKNCSDVSQVARIVDSLETQKKAQDDENGTARGKRYEYTLSDEDWEFIISYAKIMSQQPGMVSIVGVCMVSIFEQNNFIEKEPFDGVVKVIGIDTSEIWGTKPKAALHRTTSGTPEKVEILTFLKEDPEVMLEIIAYLNQNEYNMRAYSEKTQGALRAQWDGLKIPKDILGKEGMDILVEEKRFDLLFRYRKFFQKSIWVQETVDTLLSLQSIDKAIDIVERIVAERKELTGIPVEYLLSNKSVLYDAMEIEAKKIFGFAMKYDFAALLYAAMNTIPAKDHKEFVQVLSCEMKIDHQIRCRISTLHTLMPITTEKLYKYLDTTGEYNEFYWLAGIADLIHHTVWTMPCLERFIGEMDDYIFSHWFTDDYEYGIPKHLWKNTNFLRKVFEYRPDKFIYDNRLKAKEEGYWDNIYSGGESSNAYKINNEVVGKYKYRVAKADEIWQMLLGDDGEDYITKALQQHYESLSPEHRLNYLKGGAGNGYGYISKYAIGRYPILQTVFLVLLGLISW